MSGHYCSDSSGNKDRKLHMPSQSSYDMNLTCPVCVLALTLTACAAPLKREKTAAGCTGGLPRNYWQQVFSESAMMLAAFSLASAVDQGLCSSRCFGLTGSGIWRLHHSWLRVARDWTQGQNRPPLNRESMSCGDHGFQECSGCPATILDHHLESP